MTRHAKKIAILALIAGALAVSFVFGPSGSSDALPAKDSRPPVTAPDVSPSGGGGAGDSSATVGGSGDNGATIGGGGDSGSTIGGVGGGGAGVSGVGANGATVDGGADSAPASKPEAGSGGEPLIASDESVTSGAEKGSFTVSLSVYCEKLLDNMDMLKKDKRELVPADGVVLAPVEAVAYEGESVFNILRRELRRAKIHLEFVNTPLFNSAYIEGIHNLYEFDAGELSGWVYKVNGVYPDTGSSRYAVQPGDIIEWHYSLALGRDLEGYRIEGFQKDE